MSVIWHRILFDPRKSRKNFASREEFSEWCSKHLADFNYKEAGFSIPRWDHAITNPGMKIWMVIIPGQTEYRSGSLDIMRFFAEKHWVIDDCDAIMYLKYTGGDNELLFPIRGGKIPDDRTV